MVYLLCKIEVNAADCTDQHFGGGCSKTVAGIEIITDLRTRLESRC